MPPTVKFIPQNVSIDVDANTKILVAATRAKVPIRFGCGSCRCGTCAVSIDHSGAQLSAMQDDERALLHKMGLSTEGDVRLSCRARILDGTCTVDLDFQDTYSPEEFG